MLTAVVLVSLTACVVDVPVYDPLTVPCRNHAMVDVPLALTVPLSEAMVVPMFIAVPVDTIGGNKHCAGVKLFAVDPSPN